MRPRNARANFVCVMVVGRDVPLARGGSTLAPCRFVSENQWVDQSRKKDSATVTETDNAAAYYSLFRLVKLVRFSSSSIDSWQKMQ